jgi:gluconate 5-dehydrogenase
MSLQTANHNVYLHGSFNSTQSLEGGIPVNNIFDLTGKVALVTGASSGLGVQFAKALANQGADIAITARRMDRLEQVKKEIEEMGVKCLAVKCDVKDSADIGSMVKQVHSHFGRIDILVNNAGVVNYPPAEKATDEEWLSVIDVNLNGVYYTAREVGRIMVDQKYGKIINIGSICSIITAANTSMVPYATSKGAVEMMTKSLACEWAKHNITVNCLGPGYFLSEMTEDLVDAGLTDVMKVYCPMARMGAPGELDGALVYLASDASSYTTGQLLCVDGGYTTI